MTHESNDPVTKPRPVDGAEIVRLAMEWRKAERADPWTSEAELDTLRAAVDTRL
jgi:hypothetical protein